MLGYVGRIATTLLLAVIVSGCSANPPGSTANSGPGSPSPIAAKAGGVLSNTWTVINFGAPW